MKVSLKKLKAFILSPNISILVILTLASFLRLYRIQGYMTFLGDEGRDVLVVYNVLHGDFTLLGPAASVGGFFLGPIYYYLMAPFLWIFNYNPVGPAVMVAIFGVATVYLLYRFASEFFNKRVGLIAAFLYSVSPLAIAYSRSSWNPNLMPFFSLSSLYILYRAVKTNNWKFFLLCGFLLGICMQLHYLAFFLGAVIADYVLAINIIQGIYEKSFAKYFVELLKQYTLIFVGFVLGLSPFLGFEIRHGFQNIGSIYRFILKSDDTGIGLNFFSNVYDVFFRLFARLVTNFPASDQIAAGQYSNIALWYILALLLGLSSLSILVYKFIKNFPYSKEKYKKNHEEFLKFNLLFAWLGVGVILFGFYKKPIYEYYFGFMFVLPFILAAHALDFLNLKKNLLKITSVVVFIALTVVNLYGIPFKYEPNRQLKQVKTIAEFVLDKTEGKPFNFALITGGNSDHAYRYFFKLRNQDPVAIEPPPVDPQRKTVTDQLLVVCEGPCQPLGSPLWEVAGFGRAEITGEWDIIVVKVYKLVHYKDR